jgi:hypothetical protein
MEWFCNDFIAALCHLITHEYHLSDIMLLDYLYPNQIITSEDYIDILVGVNKLMVCSNVSSHFGLLVFDLDQVQSLMVQIIPTPFGKIICIGPFESLHHAGALTLFILALHSSNYLANRMTAIDYIHATPGLKTER